MAWPMASRGLLPGRAGAVASTVGIVLALAACRGETLPIDCDNQAREFRQTMESQELDLLTPTPETSPFPVAFQLSEEGMNRLLSSTIEDAEIPFTGDLQFGPASFTFEPESDPEIRFLDLPRCRQCIALSLEFQSQLLNAGEPFATGFGNVDLAIPLVLEPDEAAGVTTLYADYSRVAIDDLGLSIYGIDDEELGVYTGAIGNLLTERLQDEYDRLELMTVGTWTIGDGAIRLLARDLLVYPELGKLALGMHTNLALPESAGLALDKELPEGVPMAVTFDAQLFLAMSHRMLTEGQIPRRYDEDGDPEPTGIYGVTIDTMDGSAEGIPRFDSEFNVWRIAEGRCGNVRAGMSLNLEVAENRRGFLVAPGPASLLEGEGSGLLALEEEKEVIDQNQELLDNFRGALADTIGTTINYDAFDVDNSQLLITIVDLTVDPAEVNSFLDFQVFDKPDADDGGAGTGEGE